MMSTTDKIPPDPVVDKALKRLDRKLPLKVLEHTRHCFTVLRRNIKCLLQGLQCLERQILNDDTLTNVTTHNATTTIPHIFSIMLRLHDGYILCVSGECRHVYDQQQAAAKHKRFRSRLPQNSAVYHQKKTTVYSGTGWDEWNDPKVGLRTRADCWDDDDDDDIWETTVVQPTEHSMEEFQTEFRRLKEKLQRQLTTIFYPAKVSIGWNDKMEHIKIQNLLQLERYGSDFQIARRGSVILATPNDWSKYMQWPDGVVPQKKRRKRIVCDDDDDDDDTTTKMSPAATAGLVLKQAVVAAPATETSVSISVKDIKQSMGVNSEQLSSARETVEDEEAKTKQEADFLDAELTTTEKRIPKLRKLLYQLLWTPNADLTQLWNAREVLREELMRAGDLLLWSDPVPARKYFEQAKELVLEQKADDDYLKQNLRLVEAQAQVNIGIALIQTTVNQPASHTSKKLQDRTATLLKACDVLTDVKRIVNGIESAEIQQLQSLALRWKGTALWNLFRRDEAETTLFAASQTYRLVPGEERQEVLACRLENFHALTALTDLALDSLDRAPVQSIRDKTDFYRAIFDTAIRSTQQAIASASTLQKFCTDVEWKVLREDGISTSTTLREALESIRSWWQERLQLATQSIALSHRNLPARNDLAPSCTTTLHRIGVAEERRKPRPPRTRYNLGGGNRTAVQHKQKAPIERPPRQTGGGGKVYRKWREEKLEYPSIAPPMPLEFVEILARRQHRMNQSGTAR